MKYKKIKHSKFLTHLTQHQSAFNVYELAITT